VLHTHGRGRHLNDRWPGVGRRAADRAVYGGSDDQAQHAGDLDFASVASPVVTRVDPERLTQVSTLDDSESHELAGRILGRCDRATPKASEHGAAAATVNP
jgi:hypothetical protein